MIGSHPTRQPLPLWLALLVAPAAMILAAGVLVLMAAGRARECILGRCR